MAGPYNFESQPKFLRNLLLSANKQTAWNTALADAALTYRQRFDGAAIVDRKPGRRTDQSYAGKGTSFATNGQITSFDTDFSGFKAELSPWLAGWMFAFLMGKETVTGAAAPYTHVFSFDESTRTAVPTTIYCEDTADVKYKCPDMCVNDLTLTINDIGAIMAEMSMMGTGIQTSGALGSSLPAAPSETYLLNSDAVLAFGAVGAGTTFTGRHMNTTFKAENQLTVHRGPGGGLYGLFVRKGNPKFSISTTIAAKDTDDIYSLFLADTACVFTLNVPTASDAQLQISIPETHLKTTKLGFDGEMVIWQIEADETTCYQAAGVAPVSVSVVNDVAAYLVAA
jgi:hypothetical protein